jgi:hypothetical protein
VVFSHNAGGAAIVAVGVVVTLTVRVSVAVQPAPLVTVTLYVVVTAGLTVICCVVAPLVHAYCAKPGPASSVTGAVEQVAVGPAIATLGVGFTVTFIGADVSLQLPFVTCTVYVPLDVTTIDDVVAPLDQRYEPLPPAVRVTLPPAQNVVGPLGVIVATGVAFTVTVVAADVALQPLPSVTVTV